MKIVSFMPCRDEIDILPYTVRAMQEQGVSVYVIDNWSTDGSWEILPELKVGGRERFPSTGPVDCKSQLAMIARVTELAVASDADWCCYADADEIRRSSRNETLAEGIARLDSLGYNVIDHWTCVFQPIDEGYRGDPENYFQYYISDDHITQQKLWKNSKQACVTAGGHVLRVPYKRISPERFVLKHYPFRNSEQGRRKIKSRLERRVPEEYAVGISVHYDGLRDRQQFIWDPAQMKKWENPS